MAVTCGTLQIMRGLRRDIGTEVDDAVRALTADWVRAWDDLTPAWQSAADELVSAAVTYGRWPYPAEIMRLERVDTAMRASIAALGKLAERTETVAADGADRVVQLDAEREPRIIASQVPAVAEPGLSQMLAQRLGRQGTEALRETWSLREHVRDDVRVTVLARIRTVAIGFITRRAAERIHADTWPLSPQAVDAMRRELIAGVDVGANPRTAATRMVTAVEGQFNGGLTRAMTIARTEILDAYRATSQQIHAANADLVSGWQWQSELALRTCVSCLALHGTTYPATEPGPQDHVTGRCARLPVLAPWSELGIAAPEPPSVLPSSQDWFDGLPQADQLRIMGPGRLDLYQSGRIGWGDLSTERPSARWRPSRVPTPLRDLQRLAVQP